MLVNFGTLLLQRRKVFPIHDQNEVEFAKVIGSDLPGDTFGNVVTSLAGSRLGARIGAFANVEDVGSG